MMNNRMEALEQRRLLTSTALWTLDQTSLLTHDASFTLDRSAFQAAVHSDAGQRTVQLPSPDGTMVSFATQRTNLLADNVAAAHPEISTFRGISVDDPSTIAQFDLTSSGLNATVFSPGGGWRVQPLDAATGLYNATRLADVFSDDDADGCTLFHLHNDDDPHDHHAADVLGTGETQSSTESTGPVRRRIRIAIAAIGEWTSTVGSVTAAFNKIVSTINSTDLLYIRDFNVTLQLVSGLNLVYADASTDPYTGNDTSAIFTQNQTNVDTVIGNGNYDVAQAWTRTGGGVAYLGVVGNPTFKARGISGNNPLSSAFEPTFWHELGHQFGAAHTWNDTSAAYATQRSATSAYEPGPGSTIMSYGGFSQFPGNFVAQRDPYFHARSIESVETYLNVDPRGSAAGIAVSTGNAAPLVNAGPNHVIPANTPFELTAIGTDDSPLTYTWEQYDLGDTDPIGIDDGDGPLFRSRPGTSSPTRLFPQLVDLLTGTSSAEETLPQVSRTNDPLTFRMTARDGMGGVNHDDTDLTVIDTGAAFRILTPNTTATPLQAGANSNVTWDVAGTDSGLINTPRVDIFLSTDGGSTFTPVLLGTPNDGNADVFIPSITPATTQARIKIKGSGNVFLNINDVPLRILADTSFAPTALSYEFESRQAVVVRFDEPINVASLSLSDFTVANLTTGTTLPASSFTLATASVDDRVFSLNHAAPGVLPDGNYRITLPAGAVTDPAGNALASAVTADFFVLGGDANRDRAVDVTDLGILAANFRGTGNFSQGDFNYDGTVDVSDLGILAGNFRITLPAASSIASLSFGRDLTRMTRTIFADDRSTLA